MLFKLLHGCTGRVPRGREGHHSSRKGPRDMPSDRYLRIQLSVVGIIR